MLYRCDWCGELFDDREDVVMLETTFAGSDGTQRNPSLHACPSCAPDFVSDFFPADAGRRDPDGETEPEA